MILVELLQHHNWANEKYIEYIKSLDQATYQVPLPGSDKTIHDLVYHLTEVMWFWFLRINPQCKTPEPQQDTVTVNLLKYLSEIQQEILVWTRQADLSQPVIIQWNSNDNPTESNAENVIQNFIVHSGYHRGQLAFLLRFHGFSSIEETDVNPYIYDLAQK